MDNRGFTLVELVAIIIVLATIFLVSFPSFLNTAKLDKEKEYQEMVNNLCIAGETYIYSNLDDFPEIKNINSKINIQIEELISYGNVKSGITNIKAEKVVDRDALIYTVLEDYSLDCEYKINN